MKVYVKNDGITIVGKAWQVRRLLHQYSQQFTTVVEWLNSKETKK